MSARRTIEVGDVFGRWTAVDRRDGAWIFRCECGHETRTNWVARMRRGNGCRSCSKRGPKPRSKGWKILRHVRNQGWLGACRKCGVERIVQAVQAREAQNGCADCRDRGIDLTGKTINGWRVVGKAPRATKNQQHRWFVITPCCQKQVIRLSQHLRIHRADRCNDCHMKAKAIPPEAWVCKWDGKPVTKPPHDECAACNRRAHRNGRDAEGRPIMIGRVECARRSYEARRLKREQAKERAS